MILVIRYCEATLSRDQAELIQRTQSNNTLYLTTTYFVIMYTCALEESIYNTLQ